VALPERIVIGTRGSTLARTQTAWVGAALKRGHPGLDVREQVISTTGDRRTDRPLPEIGGKGLFTAELETALLDGDIDAAVHSMKDLPTELPVGLCVGAVPARETPFDALISANGGRLNDLPSGAKVGTSSRRRQAQLLSARPDLRIESIRGNLDTRIRKLHEDDWDAIIVAAAGLARLGRLDEATEVLTPGKMLPAVGQGALAIQTRVGDDATAVALSVIHDEHTARGVAAERAFLHALGGGCHVPIAGLAEVAAGKETLALRGLVAAVDGSAEARGSRTGESPEDVGRELAQDLLDRGAARLLAEADE
jgi:hydroxymethylbilane synthase